jgi:imidazolonepropionase-like amidohydrolase
VRNVIARAIVIALVFALPAHAETIAITGAKAWTMTSSTPVENATIVVTDGRIVSVTPGGAIPSGARAIAAEGRVVTPGLIDAATQIGLSEIGGAGLGDEAIAKGPLGAAFDLSYAIDANALTIQQARADGVARALLLPGGSAGEPFEGRGVLLHLLPGADIVELPRAVMSAGAGAGSASASGGSRGATWQLIRNALDESRAYVKHSKNLAPRDQLLNHLDAAAIAPVAEGKIPLVIEANRESDIRQALALSHDYPVRVILLGGAEAWRVAKLLADAHISVILDPFDELPMSYDQLGARRDNAALLAKAGVTLAFSVSAQGIHRSYNAGPAMREGAGVAVANGLSYFEGLAALTVGPARILGIERRAGTLASGSDADLVVWDGDPLEPSTAPTLVMLAGREVSLVTRRTLLRDRYAPQSK